MGRFPSVLWSLHCSRHPENRCSVLTGTTLHQFEMELPDGMSTQETVRSCSRWKNQSLVAPKWSKKDRWIGLITRLRHLHWPIPNWCIAVFIFYCLCAWHDGHVEAAHISGLNMSLSHLKLVTPFLGIKDWKDVSRFKKNPVQHRICQTHDRLEV